MKSKDKLPLASTYTLQLNKWWIAEALEADYKTIKLLLCESKLYLINQILTIIVEAKFVHRFE